MVRNITNRKMTPTNSLREPHPMEKSQKIIKKKTSNNGWETAKHHRT